jgi:hypothetical protein
MLACWKQHYPADHMSFLLPAACELLFMCSIRHAGMLEAALPWCPKPYTTLPEAFDGCRYLHLLPDAGWKLQLDIQQMTADCAATMRDMRGDWEAVAAAGAAAVAARAPSLLAVEDTTSTTAAAAAGDQVGLSDRGYGDDGTAPTLVQSAATGTAESAQDGAGGATSSAASDSSSTSGIAAAVLQQQLGQLGYEEPTHLSMQQQQPAVPNMTQLLQLLAYAPAEICSSASVVLVPELAQSLLFADQADGSPVLQQLQQLTGSAAASAYAAQGIQFVSDAVAASQVCDHLMACPILAFGMCSSSSSSSSSGGEAPVLLQVLAPPMISGEGAALDAAVYVFDVRGQQQQQSAALLTLLNILLEDVRVVKLVEDAAHVSRFGRGRFLLHAQLCRRPASLACAVVQ